MRSIAIHHWRIHWFSDVEFQYRKRYEVYCNSETKSRTGQFVWSFNTASGMRSIAICTLPPTQSYFYCFNTASGMRSIAIYKRTASIRIQIKFQYRKRYEGYCNLFCWVALPMTFRCFNTASGMRAIAILCLGSRSGTDLKIGFWSTLHDFVKR